MLETMQELTLAEEKKRLQQRGRDLEVRLRQLRPGREASDPEALHPALGRQRRRLQQMEAITRLLHEKLHAHDHETGTALNEELLSQSGHVPSTVSLLPSGCPVPSATLTASCASESRLMLARANQIHRFSRRFLTIRDTL